MTSALTQQWLRQVIGPYNDKERVYTDVDQVLAGFGTLRPKTDVHTFDDGREQLLLCLHGLIPITFRQSSYNIPIILWLTLNYPRDPPITYVVPTSDMLVKPSKDVDVSGRCQISYVKDWERKSEGCSIKALVEAMQEAFSRSPPLYAKPKNAAPVAATSAPTPPQPPVSNEPQPSASPLRSPPPPSLPPGYQHPLLAPSVGLDGRPILPAKPSGGSSVLTPHVAPAPSPALPFSTPSANRPPPPLPGQVQTPPAQTDRPPPPPWAQAFQTQSPHATVPSAYRSHPTGYPASPLHQQSFSGTDPYRPPPPNQQWSQPNPPHRTPAQSQPLSPTSTGSPTASANTYTPHPIQVYSPPSSAGAYGQSPPPPPAPPASASAAVPTNFLDGDDDVMSAAATAGPSIAPPRPMNPALMQLHNALHHKFTAELNSFSATLAEDGERQRATQADLLHGEPAIRDEMARLVAVRDVCKAVAERLRGTVSAAEVNVQELKKKGDPEVDELVCSTTIVYNQLINLVAEDNAIEDTIYHLHRALNSGRIDLDRFIRVTRTLAEEQFMKRALIQKITSAIPMGSTMSWS